MNSSTNTRQTGISLIELMVGITIALILISGVIAVVVNTNQSGLNNIKAVRLNTQVRAAMDFIHREVQRAGYVDAWDPDDDGDPDADGNNDGEITVQDINTAAIETFGTITLANRDGTACDTSSATEEACDCIFYSYDLDDDGVQDTNEKYGIQYNSATQSIRVTTTATGTDCSANYSWTNLTDENEIAITSLSFQLEIDDFARYDIDATDPALSTITTGQPETACAADWCLDRRKVNLVITAQLKNDAAVKVALNDEIKIKNDWYYNP